MADVGKMVEQHLASRRTQELSFALRLRDADKYEAHGMGVLIEELMTTEELAELHARVPASKRRKGATK